MSYEHLVDGNPSLTIKLATGGNAREIDIYSSYSSHGGKEF
jgi:hypothetical protein